MSGWTSAEILDVTTPESDCNATDIIPYLGRHRWQGNRHKAVGNVFAQAAVSINCIMSVIVYVIERLRKETDRESHNNCVRLYQEHRSTSKASFN